jgi:hypothetical protein
MSFDAEREISKMWKNMHATQSEIGKTFYRWRKVALELAGPDADPKEVSVRAAEIFGRDIGKSLLPRLNWLKGEEGFLLNLGKAYANLWNTDGAVATVEKGEKPGEVFIRCTRDPWPTYAKEFGVPMEEVAMYRERLFQTILEDVSVFFNIKLRIEMQRAIPKGHGMWLMRLYKEE